jgi:hypothetical protein
MDHKGPEPENGPSPRDARVEDDIVRTLRPRQSPSHLRLPAALPFAIAAILVIASVAFGANVMSSIVTPDPGATAVVVGDDDPTDAPTLVPTEAPTAVVTDAPIAVITEAPTDAPTAVPTTAPAAVPTKAPAAVPTKAPTKAPTTPPVTTKTAPPIASMTLTAVANGKIVNLTWSQYTGPYFKYYGIVRSETDAQASLPLGTVPYQYFDNINTLTSVDTTKAGHTYHYRAYAFTDETLARGNVVPNCQANTILAVSNIVDVVIPAASPTPVVSSPTTQDLGALTVNDTLAGVTFSWNAYTGGGAFTTYRIAYETVGSGKDPSAAKGSKPWTYPGITATTAGPITIAPGDYNARLEAIGTVNGSLYIYAQTTSAHVHIAAAASAAP